MFYMRLALSVPESGARSDTGQAVVGFQATGAYHLGIPGCDRPRGIRKIVGAHMEFLCEDETRRGSSCSIEADEQCRQRCHNSDSPFSVSIPHEAVCFMTSSGLLRDFKRTLRL